MKQVSFKYRGLTDILNFVKAARISSYTLNAVDSTLTCEAGDEVLLLAKEHNIELLDRPNPGLKERSTFSASY